MAFSYTVADRISFGNTKLRIYNLTDVQNDGTSYIDTGMQRLRAVKAVNNTDTADTFKEALSTTQGRVTFTSVSNDDDGIAFVWGD